MKLMKKVALLCIAFMLGLTAWAQDVPTVEIPIGFSMINVHPNLAPITSFNVFGGGGQVDFNFGNYFGIKADLMGYTQGSGLRVSQDGQFLGNVNGNVFTYMFGPQIKKHTGVFQPFGEALFGAAHTNLYGSICRLESGCLSGSGDNNGFAMAFGGGLDIKVAKHVALRPVEVDYLYTRFSANHVNFTSNQNNFRYVGGFDFMFGGAPPVPVSATCSASPSAVWSGDPVTVSTTAVNFNPKHTETYAWTGNAGKLANASGQTSTIDTTGLAPGSYTATATITDPKEKKNNTATCSANFTIKQPQPPVVSCSASPSTIAIGESATVTMTASDPQGWPLTYNWTNSGGTMSGSGTSVTVTATNADAGNTITATGTATDARANLSASCTGSATVPAVQKCTNIEDWGECTFEKNPKKPWRVDNDCKDTLDKLSLRLQQMPNGKLDVVGYTNQEESVNAQQLGAQRSVNVKYYLTTDGPNKVDASRVQPRQGGAKGQATHFYFVPEGNMCGGQLEEGTVVDENAVQPQSRTAAVPAKKSHKHKSAAPAAAPQQ
jgi:outer membrane protein OmpA-like peptidoglycan-associated protein